jgi:hypothetical protein
MPALWDKPLASSSGSGSGSSLRDLRVSVFPLFHSSLTPQRNFLAVGCGLNNFAHARAYSCRKASIGFIFAARVAG